MGKLVDAKENNQALKELDNAPELAALVKLCWMEVDKIKRAIDKLKRTGKPKKDIRALEKFYESTWESRNTLNEIFSGSYRTSLVHSEHQYWNQIINMVLLSATKAVIQENGNLDKKKFSKHPDIKAILDKYNIDGRTYYAMFGFTIDRLKNGR